MAHTGRSSWSGIQEARCHSLSCKYFISFNRVRKLLHRCGTKFLYLLALLCLHHVLQQNAVSFTPARGQEHKVLRLVKALYGLKQAPRAWHAKMDKRLCALDFTNSDSEHAVYAWGHGSSPLLVGVC